MHESGQIEKNGAISLRISRNASNENTTTKSKISLSDIRSILKSIIMVCEIKNLSSHFYRTALYYVESFMYELSAVVRVQKGSKGHT